MWLHSRSDTLFGWPCYGQCARSSPLNGDQGGMGFMGAASGDVFKTTAGIIDQGHMCFKAPCGLGPLDTQVIQQTRLLGQHQVQFHAKDGQHGKQFSGSEFCQATSLEPGQRLRRDANLSGNDQLTQAHGAPTLRDSQAKFLKGLHLIFVSRNQPNRAFLDANIKLYNRFGGLQLATTWEW